MFARTFRIVFCFGIVAVAGCGGKESGPSGDVPDAGTTIMTGGVGEECVRNSDCDSPLVCSSGRCKAECETSRDCPDGERCMASDAAYHVCQLDEETLCSYNSQCPENQICASDGQCRDQCVSGRDCLSGQDCVTGSCVDRAAPDAG